MTTDLVPQQHTAELVAEMDYARTIAGGAILPQAYRGKPADILIATGLGKAIGIAPAQSLYEIYVVNGRPSPSANLMAALVRRAGHLIRIKGDAQSCTATLVRKDDPEYPFEATWTLDQAHAAKLTGKDTWKQYPAAMLRARAIAEVVRMGASECVLGMDYSAEEMRDVDKGDRPAAPQFVPGLVTPEQPQDDAPLTNEPQDITAAEEVTDEPQPLTDATRKRMFAMLAKVTKDEDEQRAGMSTILGRAVESRASLTEDEAWQIIDHLKARETAAAIAAEQQGGEA